MINRLLRRSMLAVLAALGMQAAAQTFNQEPASVVWPFNTVDGYDKTSTVTPEGAFSIISVDLGGTVASVEKSKVNDVTYLKINPTNGASDKIKWFVKPAKGLTFTPTRVSAYIGRAGTDAKSGMNVAAELTDGTIVELGTFTGHRVNKTTADDKYGKEADYATKFDITLTAEQQAKLASTDGFTLSCTHGVVNDGKKQGAYADVHIDGIIDGTKATVAMYDLKLLTSPEGAGTISVKPEADKFEEGSEVSINTVRNFGYRFVNWTDATGKEVSKTPDFKMEITGDAVLTANYDVIPTYELNVAVDGGANDYMVQFTPAATDVQGKKMYEENTEVTLTAMSNPVVTFTNWSDGQSSGEIKVVMDGDKTLTANYSAIDYVVGWDFWRAGNNGRPADYCSADNDVTSLVLRNEAGNVSSWLDKSQVAAGGYEGRPGAVNWLTSGLGEYYWQTLVNATAFTDMKLITAMVYNFNAYTVYDVEYSVDGETWDKLGSITMGGAKQWTDAEFPLPAAANNQEKLYIRWKADKSSTVAGSSSSNDGACLGASFLIGTAKLVNDGKAPVLVSAVPAEGSTTASINGKIVLTFDEKVKLLDNAKADLDGEALVPQVAGKSVLIPYTSLAYGTKHTFTLAANSVADLTDNAIDKPITVNFTTRTRPGVIKGGFDFIVPDDGTIQEAIAAAALREDNSKRYRIFIRNGEYKLPASATATKVDQNTQAKYADPTTYVNSPNISFIGESTDGVVITNTLPVNDKGELIKGALEGIGIGDVIDLNGTATGTYMQNLTLKSSMGDKNGRDIVLNDKSDKTILKDVCLWGYQDTYVSNNDKARYYFEGGLLRGRTDFLCGKGDAYYNGCTLQMVGAGYLAVPSVPKKYGYIFKDCEIVGEIDKADGNKDPDGSYTLGRPWGEGTPIALFIDTKMTARPSAVGWNDMGTNGHPKRFAEYNSFTASGTPIDLSQRKTDFKGHANNPVLTKEEAEAVNYETVMGGDDNWDPASLAEQAPAPANIKVDGLSITWDDNEYVLCWAVCEDGKVVAFTKEPSYTIANANAKYTIRSVNEMGGLGAAYDGSGAAIDSVSADAEVVATVYYNLEGARVDASATGILIKVDTLANGELKATKVIR